MISRMQIDFKQYNADGIGFRPTTLPRVDFAALNQPWADKSTTPMVLVHVHRFPNKQTKPPKHNPPNETVGAVPVCPPERPRSGVSIREKGVVHHALCAGIKRWMRPCRATRAGTQAPPLPISSIFFHTIPYKQNNHLHTILQTKSTVYTQSSPTTSNIQTRRVYNLHTHQGRKCIAHSRPHSLKQIVCMQIGIEMMPFLF